MRRAIAILPAGTWRVELAIGTATLAYDERHRRRYRYTTDDGQDILLDLAQAILTHDGDGLALEDGGAILVRAADEELVEITAASALGLARIAYHLGNRHLLVALLPDRILVRPDHVIVEMVERLGGAVRAVRRPFEPEPGAYGDGHDHEH